MQNLFNEKPKPENVFDLFKDDEPFIKKRLKRSSNDRIIFGICAGLAVHYSVTTNLVRLLFALSSLLGGLGAFVYMILFFVIPIDDVGKTDINRDLLSRNTKSALGIALIIIGFYFLIIPAKFFPVAFWFKLPTEILFSIVFVLAGVWIQKRYRLNHSKATPAAFDRPKNGRILLGVCIGLSEYLGTYTIIVRLLFVVFAFVTMGLGIVLYFLMALLSKQERVVSVEE